ncbi:unnamed protein product [Sphagnum balticum]
MEESVPQLKTATSSAAMLQREVPSVVDKALGRVPNSVEESNPLVYSSSTMPFSRSQSVKIPVEHGSAAVERFASRPSSRLKTRNGGEEFPADLQDDDAPHLHQYARDREGRTKSRGGGGGGRNGVDIADLDAFDGYGAAAAAPIKEERASSRSSSRMKGRSSSRDTATAAAAAVGSYTGLQQEDEDLQLGASNIVVRSANGMDMADVEGYLYGMRSLQSTPRFRSSASAASMDPQPEKAATTTRSRSTSSSSSSRNANAKDTQEELRALHEVVKEIRRSNAARRSVASARGLGESTDAMEDMNLLQASLKSPRTSSSSFSYSQREAPDSLADERLSRAERHARKHQQQKSPRKLKADNTEIQLIHRENSTGAAAPASEHNTSRQATNGRLLRGEWEELQQSDDGGAYEEEEIAATQRQSRAAAPRRQHKHRPVVHDHPSPQELLTTTPPPPMLLPVSHPPECELQPEMLVAAAPSSLEQIPLNWSSATMPTTEEGFSTMNVGWLQALVDLIMWRDIPRSALWFGAGSFIILSTSFMPRIRLFVYGIFSPCYFMDEELGGCRSASQLREDNVGMGCCTTEADIVQWIRIFLPAINLVLMKTRQVFSGEPATTLKVAAVLWLLARAGSRMSLWSFVRLCYFGVFTVPKCCNCYSNQLQSHGQSIAVRAWMAWSTYSHKKAVLVVAFLLAWNMSSFSTRLWGGFMMLVWLRLYQQSHPLVFEEAVSDVSCSMGAIDLSNHQEILQQTIKAKPESVEDARQQEDPAALVKMEQVQKFPGREVNSHIYKA